MARPIAEDPVVKNIVRLMQHSRIDRRQLLRGAAVGAAATSALALTSCNNADAGEDGIVWGNWTYYLDYDEGSGSNPHA
ncbi:MAG: hypothetical protein LCH36_07090 [Actinobacteria bacterium]|nr:hypothetical protein [Actinomycetota bacterium]